MGFADQFESKKSGGDYAAQLIYERALIYDLRSVRGERIAWFILEVEPSKYRAFNAALDGTETFDLVDYGTVLYSGWGEPSASLKESLHKRYGLYAAA